MTDVTTRFARGELLLAATSDLVWFADAEGWVEYANPAAIGLLGWDLDAGPIRGSSAFTTASRAALEVDAAQTLRGRTTWSGDLTLRTAGGDPVPASVVMVAHHGPDGRLEWIATVARDQRRSAELEHQLRHRATHDSLTGLPNRDGFVSAASLALAHGEVGVLLCDVDHLKTVNDTLGRDAGDALLVQLAERVQGCLRGADVAARISGDEFVVLLPGVGATEAGAVADRVLAALTPPFDVAGRELRASVSIGVATCGPGELPVSRLLQNADLAMYLAKNGGRARAELYDESAHRRVVERLQLRQDLEGALERGEFHLLYQPLVDLADGRITGAEALLRWEHPTLGAVGPVRFIPLLEDTGGIVEVGRWVLGEALRQVAAWDAAGTPPLTVSVNVSALQLGPAFVDDVADALGAAGVTADRLTLELTETALVHDLAGAVAHLGALRAAGSHIALDDFGTGYSSLASLQALPIDQLKIDRSFVQQVARTGDTALVAGICQMAAALGMRTLAEGIEEQVEADLLTALGCDAGQGYRWSRPVPPDVLAALVTDR